jgi:hypothetical protein
MSLRDQKMELQSGSVLYLWIEENKELSDFQDS